MASVKYWRNLTWPGRVLIAATLALAVAMAFTRAVPVAVAFVVVLAIWFRLLIRATPFYNPNQTLHPEDPGAKDLAP